MSTKYSPQIITNGLVLYLDAGNTKSYTSGSTTWTDLSGNNNNGTLTNGPTFNSSNNGSIVFDGTNDYISVNNSSTNNMSTTNAFTISSWFKAAQNGIPSTSEIFHKRNNAPTYVSYGVSWQKLNQNTYNNVSCRIGFSDDTYSDLSSNFLLLNVWYLATQTFDGSNHKLYINDTLHSSASISGKTVKDENLNMTFGSYAGGSEHFNGSISTGCLYNRALSASEILQNYNATKGRYGL